MMIGKINEVRDDKNGLTPVESSEVEHHKKVDSAKVMIVHHPPEIIQGDKGRFWNRLEQLGSLKIDIFCPN